MAKPTNVCQTCGTVLTKDYAKRVSYCANINCAAFHRDVNDDGSLKGKA